MRSHWWNGDYPIIQGYGCTDFTGEPFNPNHPECDHFHDGIDIGLPCDTHITCPFAATVVQVGVYGGGPYALVIDVGGWWVWLLHLSVNFVQVGDGIFPGMVIADSGNEGFSTGCHLHFEVTPAGRGYFDSVDPTPWLTGGGAGASCALNVLTVGYTVVMILNMFHTVLQWGEILFAIAIIVFLAWGFFAPFIRAIRR
jgi:murein DD-endopeptidase MepM/ murein hydrolase activator NlpD